LKLLSEKLKYNLPDQNMVSRQVNQQFIFENRSTAKVKKINSPPWWILICSNLAS